MPLTLPRTKVDTGRQMNFRGSIYIPNAFLSLQLAQGLDPPFKGEVQWNNNAIWKVRGDNTNEHGIIVFINSAIEMKNISFKVFSYTLCL